MKVFANTKAGLAGLALLSIPALTLAHSPASAQSGDYRNRHVTVIKATSKYMVKFQASNVDRPTWEENIFHGSRLAPGASADINIDDGTRHCYYDLRATFSDGTTVERHNVNVCYVESWMIRG